MTRKTLLLSAIALTAPLALCGCIDKQLLYYYDAPAALSAETVGDDLTIYCTGALLSLAREFAGDAAEVLAVGRDTAIAAVESGEAVFALVNAEEYEFEDYPSLSFTEVGAEGTRFIVSAENDIDDVSIDDVYALFTGEESFLTIALQAKGGSGRSVFEDIFDLKGTVNGMVKSLIPTYALTADDDSGVAALVAADESAIGAVSLNFEGGGVKTVSLEGAYPSDEEYLARRAVFLVYREDAAGSAEELILRRITQ